jgi:hypothetical protein
MFRSCKSANQPLKLTGIAAGFALSGVVSKRPRPADYRSWLPASKQDQADIEKLEDDKNR